MPSSSRDPLLTQGAGVAAGVAVFGVVGEEEETLNRLAIMARFETRVPEFPEVDRNSQK